MIKKAIRILIVALIVGVSLVPLFATPVFAVTAQPAIDPTITQIHINRSLYQDNDTLVYGMYYIKYSTIPPINADENFNFYLMDSGGTIYYGKANLFVYHDGGYNHGLISFYFAPGAFPNWGDSYLIRIEEIVGQFTTPENFDITIPTSAYTTETTQAANQDELADNLYRIGSILESEYDTVFFTDYGDGMKLSDAGEVYYRGAIPGLRAMCPDLYLLQQKEVDYATKQYTTEKFDNYSTRYAGTWVGDSMDAGGDLLGMAGVTFMFFVFTLPLCAAGVIFSFLKFKKGEPGFIFASLMMIMAVIMGWMPQALFATVFQLFAIYIGYLLFFSKSSGGLDTKLMSFTTFTYFASVLICVIMEGTYFGSDEQSIINGLSMFTTYPIPIFGDVPVFDVNFLQSLGRILTWDYSFYSGSYEILRWFWMMVLSVGPVWGIIQFFVNLIPSIIAIFRPSVSV